MTFIVDDTDELEDCGRASDNLETSIRSVDPRADPEESSDPEVANEIDKRKEGPWWDERAFEEGKIRRAQRAALLRESNASGE